MFHGGPSTRDVLDLEADTLVDESVGEAPALIQSPMGGVRMTALLCGALYGRPGVVAGIDDHGIVRCQLEQEVWVAFVETADAVSHQCSYRCLVRR